MLLSEYSLHYPLSHDVLFCFLSKVPVIIWDSTVAALSAQRPRPPVEHVKKALQQLTGQNIGIKSLTFKNHLENAFSVSLWTSVKFVCDQYRCYQIPPDFDDGNNSRLKAVRRSQACVRFRYFLCGIMVAETSTLFACGAARRRPTSHFCIIISKVQKV